VVINGSFCEQPPLALIKSIEMAGCYVVDDDFMLVTRWLLDEVPPTANPLRSCPRPSCTARPPPRPSTTPRARRRASS
jgi:benzoyl-CoA reductase subunit C